MSRANEETNQVERVVSEPRYVLVPGYVRSKADGDTHYINDVMLQRLYGVDPSLCVTQPKNSNGWSAPTGAILLHPKYNGDYILPAH